ncbi:MAG TPA: stage III sporulation protein AB [Pseudogracilibacillus sp.]|nr:stage III sporulation protein AB [Pseudogracilibacillus sp.]
MKVLFSIIIILSTSLYGFEMYRKLLNRKKILFSWIDLLRRIDLEVKYHKSSLPLIFKKLAKDLQGPISEFCLNISEALTKKEKILNDIWHEEINNLSVKYSLTKDDVKLLTQLGSFIGSYSSEEQTVQINKVVLTLEGHYKKAEENVTKYRPIYQYGSILLGILIVILIV